MLNYRDIEGIFCDALGPDRRPVAVAFREFVPAGVEKFAGSEPSGCSYWRLAAAGRVFCTVPADHYNCPIGCEHGRIDGRFLIPSSSLVLFEAPFRRNSVSRDRPGKRLALPADLAGLRPAADAPGSVSARQLGRARGRPRHVNACY